MLACHFEVKFILKAAYDVGPHLPLNFWKTSHLKQIPNRW